MCPSILSEPAVKALLGFIALKRSPRRAPVETHFEEQKPNLRIMPPTQTSNSGANVSWGLRDFLNPFLYCMKSQNSFFSTLLKHLLGKGNHDVSDVTGEFFKRQVSGLL